MAEIVVVPAPKTVVFNSPKAPEPPKQEAPKPEPKIDAPIVSSADILKRTSEPKPLDTSPPQETNYREDLEKITDPVVKGIADKALKDFESGYNKKYQTLAQKSKELDDMKAKISTWTPQRLQEELKNPAFVQSMQILQQSSPPSNFEGSTDEWSNLSDSEKQRIKANEIETQSLKSQMAKLMASQEDTETKKLYPDYDPQIVEEAIQGLRSGQITASRADIWKVVNHDKNVEKGYQYGYEDGYKKALEKVNGSSVIQGGLNVTGADEVPEDVKKGGFSSIAIWRLNRAKAGAKKA